MTSWLQRWFGDPEPLRLHGIPVDLRNSRPDIADADVLARLDEALGLIAQYQPLRFRHLVRDVRGFAWSVFRPAVHFFRLRKWY